VGLSLVGVIISKEMMKEVVWIEMEGVGGEVVVGAKKS